MLPLIVDIRLLRYMLRYKNEEIMKLLNDLSIDLNFLIVPWFLLIFVEISNFELQHIIFSRFLVDGVLIYFKVALVIFKECEEKLHKAKNMLQFSEIIKEHFKGFKEQDIARFSDAVNKIFINP